MTKILQREISELEAMKKYPQSLFYRGNTSLLDRPKVSIVGARRTSHYTRQLTAALAKSLAKRGVCIVSGAAMGVDTAAHIGAGAENTIAVVANGLDIKYPAINRDLIENIEKKGLMLSQFEDGSRNRSWTFVVRNELVVALGDILIVAEADINSGSMHSVQYALKMKKEIWVLPQRLNESLGTNALVKNGEAKQIFDIEDFASRFGSTPKYTTVKDDFFYFCQASPTLDEAVGKYGNRIYEEELGGSITIDNGRVMLS